MVSVVGEALETDWNIHHVSQKVRWLSHCERLGCELLVLHKLRPSFVSDGRCFFPVW